MYASCNARVDLCRFSIPKIQSCHVEILIPVGIDFHMFILDYRFSYVHAGFFFTRFSVKACLSDGMHRL